MLIEFPPPGIRCLDRFSKNKQNCVMFCAGLCFSSVFLTITLLLIFSLRGPDTVKNDVWHYCWATNDAEAIPNYEITIGEDQPSDELFRFNVTK